MEEVWFRAFKKEVSVMLKTVEEHHLPVAGFFLSSAFWFVMGTLAGLILAASMIAPQFALYENISWLVFGRIRPIHTNIMIFGFVGSALLGCVYYYVPRLARQPLYMPAWAALPSGSGICSSWAAQ